MNNPERTSTSKLFKEMALLCSLYDVDFRSFVVEQKIDVENDLSRKVDFVLADYPYNVLKDQSHDHAKYYVFGFKVMKSVAKVLDGIKKPGAHGPYLLCSTICGLVQGCCIGINRRPRQC